MIICQIISSQDSNNAASESRFYPGRQTGPPRAQQVPSPRSYRIESVQTRPCAKHEKPLIVGLHRSACAVASWDTISSPILQQPHHQYWGPSSRLPPLAFKFSSPPHGSCPSSRATLKLKPCSGVTVLSSTSSSSRT